MGNRNDNDLILGLVFLLLILKIPESGFIITEAENKRKMKT